MAKSLSSSSSSTAKDAQALIHSLRSAYAATPTNLKIIDLYVVFAVLTGLIQVVYMAIVGSFPFNSFLSGVLSCVGTAVLAVCLRIQVNKENKEFKDLPQERAFADFVLCNLVLHLARISSLARLSLPKCGPLTAVDPVGAVCHDTGLTRLQDASEKRVGLVAFSVKPFYQRISCIKGGCLTASTFMQLLSYLPG